MGLGPFKSKISRVFQLCAQSIYISLNKVFEIVFYKNKPCKVENIMTGPNIPPKSEKMGKNPIRYKMGKIGVGEWGDAPAPR